MYQEVSIIGHGGLAFGHSLFGLIKIIYQHLAPESFGDAGNIQRLSTIYSWGAMISLGLLSLYFIRQRDFFWKRVALLVLAMNLIPHVSGDYKLLYLFIPLSLFLGEKESEEDDIAFSLILGLLLIPKAYASFAPSGLNLGVVLNPLIMLMGVLLIMRRGIKRGLAGNAREPGKGSSTGLTNGAGL
jgi:hypothetical protein